MPLRLRLKPHERVVISGAVLRNGSSRVELYIENTVPVLRQSDILRPAEAQTPAQRVYLALQLMYVDPGQRQAHHHSYFALAAELAEAAPSCRRILAKIDAQLAEGQLYRALKTARMLLHLEQGIMAHVQQP
jgi:flagellar biosynthesis repressor protein FlbT